MANYGWEPPLATSSCWLLQRFGVLRWVDSDSDKPQIINKHTIWLFNIAMENGPFIDDFENRVCQEQERNELEQEGWHGAIVMLLSENHSADQSAFLDLCVSPSASILLFFLLFLLLSTHSNFYSNFFQNQIGRSYSCSQKLLSLTLLDLSLLDLCSSVQSN